LFGLNCVFLPIGERVGFFFATSIGASGGYGFAKRLDEIEGKIMFGITNPKSADSTFESLIYTMKTLADNGDGTRKEVVVEVVGYFVKLDILFSHLLAIDGDTNLPITIAFEGEEFGDCFLIGSVSGDAIASFGREDD